ncbi:MAG TPA: helicase-related protein [Bryobacteraceae bacterium]|nr:helicase-related protein [Bryobacteraceae bacterium]
MIQHRDWAQEWLSENNRPLRISEARLARLALIASFSPANCLLRSIESVYSADQVLDGFEEIVAVCLGAMRRYFNRTHVQQLIRSHRPRTRWHQFSGAAERGYAKRVLVYAADAHLQAVLDEYVYLLCHAAQAETVSKVAERLEAVWGLVPGKPRANGAKGRGNLVTIETEAEAHTSHFALSFGDDVWRGGDLEEEGEKVRKSAVREAFNSPFWPFVLATTSVGQEGLDFHLYCRDVLHWNLPSNPVDLEQREGRVNRRDCLAVRESIALDWRLNDPATWGNADRARNPWPFVFDSILASDDHQKYKHGLFPRWIYECRDPSRTVRIQRHVPVFSTSRDAAKYERLKTGLALYRLVFGQANQEDLLDDLQSHVESLSSFEQEQLLKRLASYMLNLSPISHEQALRHAENEADDLLREGSGAGLQKLIVDVERMRAERQSELASIDSEVSGLLQLVRRATAMPDSGEGAAVRSAIAALAYLRNPYDRVFDLHVEGGFVDDVMVIKDAWATVLGTASSERS